MPLSVRPAGGRPRFTDFPKWNADVGRMLDQFLSIIQRKTLGYPTSHEETHLQGGSDSFPSPTAIETIDPNLPGDIGDGPGYMLEDARHPIDLKLTTKGDLLTRSSTLYVRHGVGTDGDCLVADSTTSTGLAWGTPQAARDAEYLAWVL